MSAIINLTNRSSFLTLLVCEMQLIVFWKNTYKYSIHLHYTVLCCFQQQKLSFLPLNGKVDVKNPTHEFYLFEDYGDHPNTAPEHPLRVFFGRLIAHGQRHLISRYAVKERFFIGNTSMDAQLSLIMANQGKVFKCVSLACGVTLMYC